MPQPKNQKRRNAIAGYQKAIAGWRDVIRVYQASIHQQQTKEKMIALAETKIVRLSESLRHTQAKLGFGG